MFESIFQGLFDTQTAEPLLLVDFLLCIGVSLVLGLLIAFCYRAVGRATHSFILTLAVLPAVVCVVIMMVNGNIGAGVAVAGAFSLVRFRSAPGSAKEIVMIFLAMGTGLIVGMGYLAYATVFALIVSVLVLLYSRMKIFDGEENTRTKLLKITIPEDLDYTGVFDGVFDKYTEKSTLVRVKSTNLGSMFRLTYRITLKKDASEKEFLDALRVYNGNLEIMISREEMSAETL